MSVLLTRVEWYSADDPETQVLSLSPLIDMTRLTSRKGIDIKNNILDITLKNPHSKYVSSGVIRFQEEDVLKFYIKDTDDGSDITGTWWGDSTLIGTYYVEEFEQSTSAEKHSIKISGVDKAYVLFNKVFTQTYGVVADSWWTTPGVIRSVSRINSSIDSETQGYLGTDLDDGVRFDLQANFVSEGGYIVDSRDSPTTTLDGGITDSDTTITVLDTTGYKSTGTLVIGTEHIYYTGITGTEFTGCVRGIDATSAESALTGASVLQGFPIVDITKIWKPIYEWFGDMSQNQYTNYDDETGIGDILEYNRTFMLWVDKDNKLHWFYPDDTVDTSLVVGENDIYELSLKKSVFDSVNMVIYNVGEDMYGAGAVWYWYDENTDVGTLKMRYQPMIEHIDNILNKEYLEYPARYPSATVGQSNRRFPSSYASLTEWTFKADSNQWRTQVKGLSARASLTSDTEYSNSLREAALWRGQAEAKNITQQLSGLRYSGTLTTRGTLINPGDLITVTDEFTGVINKKLRVLDVTQTISLGQWATTLDLEEDEKVIG